MSLEWKPQKNELKEYNNWSKPDLRKESGEFERVLNTFYNLSLNELPEEYISEVLKNYDLSESELLSDIVWSVLHNSESWDLQKGDYQKLETIISGSRDWEMLRESYQNNEDIECPIIAYIPEKDIYHLVSGNTRLSVAKAEGIRPRVIIMELKNPKK
jgi:hypothetical protein